MPEHDTESFRRLLEAARLHSGLTLSMAKLSSDAICQLFTALQQNTIITYLRLEPPFKLHDSNAAKLLAEAIKNSTTLEIIYLIEVELTEIGASYLAEALKQNTSIKNFNFTERQANQAAADAIIRGLINNRVIDHLYFNIKATDASLASAMAAVLQSQLTSLRYFAYRDSFSTEQHHDGMAKLIEHLHFCPKLSSLSLQDCKLNELAAQQLAQLIGISQCLESIELWGCSINTAGGIAIANALQTNRSITHAQLAHNCFGPEGLLAFSEAVEHNTVLHFLCLSWNRGATPTQMIAPGTLIGQRFAEALTKNQTITNLSLIGNGIDEQGAMYLAEVLTSQKSLKYLELACNPIGDQGCLAFLPAIKSNHHLENLQLIDEVNRSTLQEFIKAYLHGSIPKIEVDIAYKTLSTRLSPGTVYSTKEQACIYFLLVLMVLQQADDSYLSNLPDEILIHIAIYNMPNNLKEAGWSQWMEGRSSLQKIQEYAKHLLICQNCQTLKFSNECDAREKYIAIETELLIYKLLKEIRTAVTNTHPAQPTFSLRSAYSLGASFYSMFTKRNSLTLALDDKENQPSKTCCIQ